MKILTTEEIIEAYTKHTSKFCMHMVFNTEASIDEIIETAPFLKNEKLDYLLLSPIDYKMTLMFDTEEEMEAYFNQIKDNGIVFAVTCGNGELLDEI